MSWKHGRSIRLAANPSYWRGQPKLDAIDFQIAPNQNTILTKLKAHEADLGLNGSQTLLSSYEHIDGLRVVLTPEDRYAFDDFNLANPTLADRRVRQALVLVTDRRELIAKVTHGVQMAVKAINRRIGAGFRSFRLRRTTRSARVNFWTQRVGVSATMGSAAGTACGWR